MGLRLVMFTCNPFAENSFLLYQEKGEALLIDAGFSDAREESSLIKFLDENGLKLTAFWNTHAHIDHIMGNAFIHDHFGLLPLLHEAETGVMKRGVESAALYGLRYTPAPEPEEWLKAPGMIKWAGEDFEIRLAPGHSPGSLLFIHHGQRWVLGGDVLFNRSIGRTDLPGGNHQQLLDSIEKQLFTLPDDYTVYPGHGPSTTIGEEKQFNPFLR